MGVSGIAQWAAAGQTDISLAPDKVPRGWFVLGQARWVATNPVICCQHGLQ